MRNISVEILFGQLSQIGEQKCGKDRINNKKIETKQTNKFVVKQTNQQTNKKQKTKLEWKYNISTVWI